MYGVLDSPKNRTKKINLTLLWYFRSNFFCSFFGRIEDTINSFRDLLTFSTSSVEQWRQAINLVNTLSPWYKVSFSPLFSLLNILWVNTKHISFTWQFKQQYSLLCKLLIERCRSYNYMPKIEWECVGRKM